MRIGIFGGTAGIGLSTIQQLLESGHTVTALARTPEKLSHITTNRDNLKIITGDVFNKNSVDEVIKGQDVIVNTLGSRALNGDIDNTCSEGTKRIVESMKELQVKRLITVTSFGVGDSWINTGYILGFIGRFLIRNALRDKGIQEDIIKASGLKWITIRPAILTDGDRTGKYRLGTGITGMWISRKDVADCICRQIGNDEWLLKTPTLAY